MLFAGYISDASCGPLCVAPVAMVYGQLQKETPLDYPRWLVSLRPGMAGASGRRRGSMTPRRQMLSSGPRVMRKHNAACNPPRLASVREGGPESAEHSTTGEFAANQRDRRGSKYGAPAVRGPAEPLSPARRAPPRTPTAAERRTPANAVRAPIAAGPAPAGRAETRASRVLPEPGRGGGTLRAAEFLRLLAIFNMQQQQYGQEEKTD